MTKTKRQLRAEAVERLNEVRYGGDAVEFCEALLGERWSGENLRERIADLLTDEELPEGDAIGLLRDFPRTHTVGYVPVGACKDRKMRDIEDLYIIADMVERDYVRRDAVEDVIRGRDYTIRNAKEYIESLQDAVAAKPLEGEAEKWERRYYECNESYAELARERDELKRQLDTMRDERDEALEIRDKALGDAATFKAERDCWRRQEN